MSRVVDAILVVGLLSGCQQQPTPPPQSSVYSEPIQRRNLPAHVDVHREKVDKQLQELDNRLHALQEVLTKRNDKEREEGH